MVKRSSIGVLLLSSALSVHVEVHGEERRVERLVVTESGKSQNSRDEMTVAWCRNFKPTAQQLRRFFLNAYPVPGSYMVDDHYSDCYATGEIAYNDRKSSGSWTLYSTGVARIDWALGGTAYVYFRKNKWRDPMAE